MFDFENPFKVAADIAAAAEQVEELTACDHETADTEPNWENADWEQITHDHAAQGHGMSSERIYSKIHTKINLPSYSVFYIKGSYSMNNTTDCTHFFISITS